MKKTMDVRRVVALSAALACILAGTAGAGDSRKLMTQGKLDADLGRHSEAVAAFEAIADDATAPPALRWEALVRLGLARSAGGDPAGSAAAFRAALDSRGDDPEAMGFLTRSVAGTVPGKIWPDFREELEELLQTAPVVATEELGPGIRPKKVTLRGGDVELSAVWKTTIPATPPRRGQYSSRSEVAAYVLDEMLGLDMVPPTVRRTLEGEEGALQLWVYGCSVYAEVQDRAPGAPEWTQQLERMAAFDYLINNPDRNSRNILVDPGWQAILIDHSAGFSSRPATTALPDRFDGGMVERLRQLTRPALQASLDGVLTEEQVDALLERRDAMLAHVDERIAKAGEEGVLF